MTAVLPITRADDALSRWRASLVVLGASWAVLLLMFRDDVADLAEIYWESTTFGHCLFIAPITAWLVWQRRQELAALTPIGWWPAVPAMTAAVLVWAIGEIAGVALMRHLGLVLMLQASVLGILGPQIVRGLVFPLGYMLFLVPFGEQFERPLQLVTVELITWQLDLVGLPARVDGVLITTPSGYFEVAEACSGNKFLIAMIAYGTLVAGLCFRSWWRRIAFMAAALLVPILANGIRAFGTIYAAHLTSVEAATGFDHIVYGWVFFALVMAVMIALGWRWFDRHPDAPAFDPADLPPVRSAPARLYPVTIALLAVAAAGLSGAAAITARADPMPARIDLPAIPGWNRIEMSRTAPWAPNYRNADHFLIGRYADDAGNKVDLSIAVYGGQREGHELIAYGQGPLGSDGRWVRVADLPPLAGGAAIRMIAPGPVEREAVTWYRVGDVVTSDPSRVKIETLRAKLLGGPHRAVAITLSAERGGRDSRSAIAALLRAAGPIHRLADRAASGRID